MKKDDVRAANIESLLWLREKPLWMLAFSAAKLIALPLAVVLLLELL